MLQLRPNCEWCDKDLDATSGEARICSYECTYCATCVDTILRNVCPTCGGGFAPRPIRPLEDWRSGSGLGRRNHPPSDKRVNSSWTREEVEDLSSRLADVAPEDR